MSRHDTIRRGPNISGQLVAGVDCSTQQTKVLLVDIASGRIVAEATAPHQVLGERGARETHPGVWDAALRAALSRTGRASDAAAISIAGQQHGLVVCDGAGTPLRPALLWNDVRSAPQAEHLTRSLGAQWWASEVGVLPVPSVTVTKWAWLVEHEPDIARRTVHVGLPHDWLTRRLTGAHTTDRGDVSGTGWWSVRDGTYAAAVLAAVDLDPRLLPEVVAPELTAGQVNTAAAALTGLRAGIPVAVGTGDNMAAALGLGLRVGVPVVSLGTSGTAYTVSARPAADPSGTVAGFADAEDGYLPLACTLNCTLAVDRHAAWLGIDREQVAANTSVVSLPYLDGERTPNLPSASGLLVGLRHATTREEVLLAVYEGAAASLVEALGSIDEHSSGLDPTAPLVLIGGGARGRVWQDVVGRLSGRPLRIPEPAEFVALGAAAQAAALLTGESASAIGERWGHGRGREVDAVQQDVDVLARIAAVRTRAERLLAS